MRNDIRLAPLPNPFIFENGNCVTSVADWTERRKEISNTLISLEYDGIPPKPDFMQVELISKNDSATELKYSIKSIVGNKEHTFNFIVYKSEGEHKAPVILTGDAMYTQNCTPEVIEEAKRRNFIVVKFDRLDIVPDCVDSERKYGINALYNNLDFSAISAWCWGYHRVVDALFTLDFADTENIAITGHSRGGKAVVLAGATDDRIKFVNPNGSGTHGCGCYRFIQVEEEGMYEDATSEPLSFLFEAVPHWMGKGLKKYIGNESDIPYDMHYLKALIAPRFLLETNGHYDIWANPRGSYLTHLAAKEVWKLYGKEQNCKTYYGANGHKHQFEEFCVLFDFIENSLNGKETIFEEYYTDMKPLHNWKCPSKE